ncbi:BspA family leucine-rich repeat surface protein [Helicobacter ailurogastricus]|uniref:BspA family leucine-rich repeat surface protein n=1 Tax=Helicobacter ailurogastricus TaxID=1578720 RepID=UPI0022C74025|nr:BspA family leucine-rich repeat surface protein [Helicobacter ailurogastricus]GLH57625.1 hypothetical protein NHP214376_04120 [Helicobacter ailurogastricus]GLH59739.1 hypothetical protein NHP214377_10080 [Helicobacter ailurogastricus]
MQQALEKLEQEIKAVKRAGRLAKGVLEEGLEARSEAKELHAKFSALTEALAHLNQALDTHYASLEDDDTQLEQALISLKRIKSKMATPLASLESASSAKEVLEALTSLEQGVLDLEGVLASLKEHPTLSTPTSPKATPKMAKKYCPQSKEELKALVADESVHLGEIDISQITDLSFVFSHATGGGGYAPAFTRKNFEGLENWDTSHVTNMRGMFYNAINFNHKISQWDVSKVKDMSHMFQFCENFNKSLDDWDVSNVENMAEMFCECESFNQPFQNWDVSKVKNMRRMFLGCWQFNQPLERWAISSVEDMEEMFKGCEGFYQVLDYWNLCMNFHANTENIFEGLKFNPMCLRSKLDKD